MCSTVARGRIFSLSREKITAVGLLDPCPVLVILNSKFISVKWECWYFQSYLEDYMNWQEPYMWKRWKKCSFHVPYCTSSLLIFLSSHPLLFQNPVLCGTLSSVKPRLPNPTRSSLPHSLPCGHLGAALRPLLRWLLWLLSAPRARAYLSCTPWFPVSRTKRVARGAESPSALAFDRFLYTRPPPDSVPF